MRTHEIPRAEWPEFLDRFSHRHAGWLTTIEILGGELGAQVEARELPLAGISAEKPDGEIAILMGGTPDQHLAHLIPSPSHLRLAQTDEGADEALQIESAEGPTTLLRFRVTLLPEMVDGIVEGQER